jgi:hypothetical protein
VLLTVDLQHLLSLVSVSLSAVGALCFMSLVQVLCRSVQGHHNSVICLTAGPYPLPKRVLHRVPSGAFLLKFQYALVSLRSSSSCLRLFPRVPITCIFPLITCSRRQFDIQDVVNEVGLSSFYCT